MSRTCRICQQERPNEAYNARGHRVRVCKSCQRLKHEIPPHIELLDEIAQFLSQSNISAKNVVRLENLVQSMDAEVRDWSMAVLEVARRYPRKRRRYVRMTRESPDLLRRLRDLLGEPWWDALLAHGVLGEAEEFTDDTLFPVHRGDTRSPQPLPSPNDADARPSESDLKRVTVHTDGACQHNPGPGGWAAILRYGDRTKELKGSAPSTTNNRMELQAAIAALAALKYRCAVEIVTDSKYLRDGVTRWVARWKANGWKTVERDSVKNRDLWEQLDEQCARHQVTWRWIRGHAGHPDNERCDALARAEINRPPRDGNPAAGSTAAAPAKVPLAGQARLRQ